MVDWLVYTRGCDVDYVMLGIFDVDYDRWGWMNVVVFLADFLIDLWACAFT